MFCGCGPRTEIVVSDRPVIEGRVTSRQYEAAYPKTYSDLDYEYNFYSGKWEFVSKIKTKVIPANYIVGIRLKDGNFITFNNQQYYLQFNTGDKVFVFSTLTSVREVESKKSVNETITWTQITENKGVESGTHN
jgi:hypothetical protein